MSKKITFKNPKAAKVSAEGRVNTRQGCKRFTLDLPDSLHTKLKTASAKSGQTMSAIVQDLLEKSLESRWYYFFKKPFQCHWRDVITESRGLFKKLTRKNQPTARKTPDI